MTQREMVASPPSMLCTANIATVSSQAASVFISAHQFYNETQMRMAVDRHTGYMPQE
ncbi:hypothetical protein C7434_0346 [Pantoea sp. PNA 14-12]|uniref:hypothetical protein n=1 Tax=Pantoea TaxID=53335 RepID=UPI0002F4CD28|nr:MULTISPECIES: hypothetical protein [Pantoea]PXV78971.1 hypothetical protein C7433_1011202 [Pantoea sp. PNA 03-3]QIE98909.1 hypothetical protein G5574_19265 [Pantoea stewartii]TDS71571.1 hypothetical protein C7434_0346 [Pantoea sp. PNA 14-12]WHS97695.1 MAG: hypothetical protein LZT29_00558 [Pantoea stewartii]